jgi:sodium/proline symporter
VLITIFVVYLVVVLGIGLWTSRRSKTESDYVLGGGKLSGTTLAFSERATGESAWLLLGLTGHAYAEGVSCLWVALGCVLGILFIWFIMSSRLRRMTERTGALTVPGLLSRRYPGSERSIGILSAVVVIFFFLFYIAAQFSGAGSILEETFGIDPTLGIVIGSVVVTLYCLLGGFIAVVATDLIQSILMIATLVVLPIVALFVVAANDVNLAASLSEAGPALSTVTAGHGGLAAVLFVLSGLSWALGYTGQPQLLTRMMAMRSDEDVRRGKWVATIWTLLAYTGALLIGITGFALVKAGVLGGEAGHLVEEAQDILPVMIMGLLTPILAGILLSGAISAMMSTADSELLVCSSSASEDVVGNVAARRPSQRKMLLLTRGLTLIIGALALVLALTMEETVYSFVSYAWAGLGSSFGPALVLMLFWKRFSRAGVFASLICGAVGTVIWKNLLLGPTGVSERLGSYVFAFVMAVLFSLLLPDRERATEETA